MQYRYDRFLEKLHFILSVRSDFHRTDSQSIAVYAIANRVLISFSFASMDLSNHLSSPHYPPSLPESLPGYILYRHRAVVDRFYLVVQPLLVHVKWSTRSISLMSSSLILQQCPACLVHLIWIIFVMAVLVLFCRVLPPGFGLYNSQYYCVIAVKLFLRTLSYRPCGAPI